MADDLDSLDLHDELGDWIDPLLWTGVALYLWATASPTTATELAAATIGLSLLWIAGVSGQPFRQSADLVSHSV